MNDGEFYGNDFGVYCVKGQETPDHARTAALNQCMTETSKIYTDTSALKTGAQSNFHAVSLDCYKGKNMLHSQIHKLWLHTSFSCTEIESLPQGNITDCRGIRLGNCFV